MFLKAQLQWNVMIPAANLDAEGLMLKRAIIFRLMNDFAAMKATSTLGYFIAVTTLDKIGEGTVLRHHSGDVLFPVDFTCITFKPFMGEVLNGEVLKIMHNGVFIKCGPLEDIFIPKAKMKGYSFVPGENPIFLHQNLRKIEEGVNLRFMVIGNKFMDAEKEFKVLASMDGDYLGPK